MNTLIEKIREGVIGQNMPVETVFGLKPLVYADYTASGRGLDFIEDFIRHQVLPFYANTHTETTLTGATTTAWRESARRMVRSAVNGQEHDKVIFCGSGATSAINKLIDIMNLRLPAELDSQCGLSLCIADDNRPVVFIGPYEHHSNELPWRESIAIVEVIPLSTDGGIDIAALEAALLRHQHRTLLIGSFSAASNVTGIKTDVALVYGPLDEVCPLGLAPSASTTTCPYFARWYRLADSRAACARRIARWLSPSAAPTP
jgi:selenocysteine lyase/cysteine desulfurase